MNGAILSAQLWSVHLVVKHSAMAVARLALVGGSLCCLAHVELLSLPPKSLRWVY